MKKTKRQSKFEYVMQEFAAGKLKSSSGRKVTTRAQAMAIAASESGMKRKPKKKEEEKKKRKYTRKKR
jgi:hypothetical protein